MKLIIFVILIGNVFGQAAPEEIQKQSENFFLALEGQELAVDLVRVRTQMEFGIKVPVLTEFSVIPEVELYYVKNER